MTRECDAPGQEPGARAEAIVVSKHKRTTRRRRKSTPPNPARLAPTESALVFERGGTLRVVLAQEGEGLAPSAVWPPMMAWLLSTDPAAEFLRRAVERRYAETLGIDPDGEAS